ncbi:hypothetical protein [Streptomyces sp. NPDC058739]|uniref:hypothetical protein n=1 Tax=Streptomyces sp. NPDC058739 TaxID=3346618 RepID=UPI0036C38AB4
MAEHLDAHLLNDLALRSDARPTKRQGDHLERCAQCRDELEHLRRVVRTARAVTTEDLPVAPPERVWHSIQAELGPGPDSTTALRPRT